jgi:hypothetical protein
VLFGSRQCPLRDGVSSGTGLKAIGRFALNLLSGGVAVFVIWDVWSFQNGGEFRDYYHPGLMSDLTLLAWLGVCAWLARKGAGRSSGIHPPILCGAPASSWTAISLPIRDTAERTRYGNTRIGTNPNCGPGRPGRSRFRRPYGLEGPATKTAIPPGVRTQLA